ncbi:MAG TPA: plastocyanin/azurin family copper-binding protein [Actinomycetota bacterium]|nr:plastocyanin/azurin family copper-binding protein [Actinomycetota bacterium]
MVRRIVVVVALVLGLVSAPGTSGAGSARFKAVSEDGQYSWSPMKRAIVTGDKIVWVNPTSAEHTVTAYRGAWGKDKAVPAGASIRMRFSKAGKYKFHCTVKGHSVVEGGKCTGMCGTVVVR